MKVLLLMFFIGSNTSCSYYKNIHFQELKPARINLGDDVKQISIYSKHLNIQQALKEIKHEYQFPSIASIRFSKFLKPYLEQTPLLYKTRIRLLGNDTLLKFQNAYPGIVVTTDIIEFYPTKKQYRNDWMWGVGYKLTYCIYSASKKTLIQKNVSCDTIWYKHTYLGSGVSIFDKFDACVVASEQAAMECANFIVPHWKDASRKFYYKPGAFARAYRHIKRNDLEGSMSILHNKVFESSNPKRKADALYNLAIVHELKDEITQACQLADSSLKIKNSIRIKQYGEQLYSRKAEKDALDLQMKDP